MKKAAYIVLISFCSCIICGQEIALARSDRPVVETVINGRLAYMMIDTGSSLNILDVNTLHSLGIKKKYTIGEVSSASNMCNIYRIGNSKITIGECEITQFVGMDLESVSKSVFGSTGIKIVGILGTPAIKQLGMIIDLSRGLVTIKSDIVK